MKYLHGRLDYSDTYSQALVREVSKQKEELLMEQLNELCSRGLIVIETTGPMLVQEHQVDSAYPKVRLMETIKLKLKDQEYIERLESETKELREKLDSITKLIDNKNS